MNNSVTHRSSSISEQSRNTVTSGVPAIFLVATLSLVLFLSANQLNADCSISPQIDAYADSYGLPELAELDDISISGNRMYVYARYIDGEFVEELITFDISNPSDPVVLGVSPPILNIYGATAVGTNYVCLSDGNLRTYSMDDPTNPDLIGTLDIPQSILSYQISGGLAFLGTLNSVIVVDISYPTNPVIVGTIGTSAGRTLTKPAGGILPG